MANVELVDPASDFYVVRNCVGCPTCRQVAPIVFGDGLSQPVVMRQLASSAKNCKRWWRWHRDAVFRTPATFPASPSGDGVATVIPRWRRGIFSSYV